MTEPRKPVTQVIGGAGISDASRFGEAPEAIHVDENKLIAERREKLKALRAQGNAFPNDFRPDAFAGDLGHLRGGEHGKQRNKEDGFHQKS